MHRVCPEVSLLPEVLWKMLVLEGWMRTFGESLVGNARFGRLDFTSAESLLGNARFANMSFYFWWKPRGKWSFWKFGFLLLVKASWKMLVLEVWISLLVKVPWKMLVLKLEGLKSRFEAWSFTLGESLALSSKSDKQKPQERVSRKSVLSRVSSKSV